MPKDRFEKLISLISAVPEDIHLMHGDYHVKNVMLQNGESLLIDMDTLCIGLTRLMRREIRRDGLSREDGRRMIEACRDNLVELLPGVDTLVF